MITKRRNGSGEAEILKRKITFHGLLIIIIGISTLK